MRGRNGRRPAAASTPAAASASRQRDPEDDPATASEESGDEEVVSSSSGSESESESDGDAERELERALADVPFGELQRARADGSLAARPASAAAARKKARRENRQRPMEISTNVRPPRFREVIQVPKKVVRDPRFEPIYGPLDKEGFRKRYNFLFDDELPAEKEKLQKTIKKLRDPNPIEEMRSRITWIDKQLRSHPRKNIESEILRVHIKKEKEAAKTGKRPYYLKKSEIRERKLMKKYNELKVLLYAILMVILLSPFDMFYLSSRFYFLRTVWRIILPLQAITFPNFFLADIFTSMSKDVSRNSRMRRSKVKSVDEVEKAEACQLEFGSYCLWSIEHKEVMKDAIVKRLKDQLFVARSYYPSIAKFKGKEALTRELKQNIQEHERVLSESIVDADLPSFIKNKIEKMDQAIARAKSCTVDCNNVDRKLRQILHMTEDEAHFHMKQSAYLYNLGVHTMPKSHHCLNMRLTVEYFKSTPLDSDAAPIHKFNIPDHRHYVILSKNVLAASVVVNSTVSSSEETGNVVFHVLTDAQNFYAMKHWFARNSYRESAVHVINYEHIILENLPEFVPQQLYLPEEFRVFISSLERPTEKTRMKYLSVFSHSLMYDGEASGKLDTFMEKRRRKNASKDHRYMPYRRNGDGA